MRVWKHPETDTADWVIETLNRIVAKDRFNRTLTRMAAQLRAKNPGMHYYEFNLLNEKLSSESHF